LIVLLKFKINMKLLVFIICLFSVFQSNSQTKRIIEIIDDNLKANQTMASAKNPFYTIIYEAATIGRKGTLVTAYRDTSLTKTISPEEIKKIGSGKETFPIYPDPENNPDLFYDTTVVILFDPVKISRFLIISDVTETNGIKEYKLIAIAPLIETWIGNVKVNEQVMFWLRFDDFSEVLGKEIFFAPENPGNDLTYKDFFEKRFFIAKTEITSVDLSR